MQELSPELALVDEDLARAARAALPPAPDVLAAIGRKRESEPVRRLRAALVADALPAPRRSRRPILRLVAGGLAGLGAIAVAAVVLPPEASAQAAQVPAVRARPAAVRAVRPVPVHAVPAKKAAAPAAPHQAPSVKLRAAVVRRTPAAPAAPRP